MQNYLSKSATECEVMLLKCWYTLIFMLVICEVRDPHIWQHLVAVCNERESRSIAF